ncbi:hypothetical protein BH24ACT5_BH24ACT5_25720 [soil metagenome]
MLEWAVARRYINWNPTRIAKLPKDRSATNGHKDLEMVVKRYRHRTDGVVKSHVAVLGSLAAK